MSGGMRAGLAVRWLAIGLLALGAGCSDSNVGPELEPVGFVRADVLTMLLKPGESRRVTATAYAAGGQELSGRQITFSSSDPSVATVDAAGLVTAVRLGGAVITATSAGRSASTRVDVLDGDAYRLVGGPNSGLPAVIEQTSYVDEHGAVRYVTSLVTDGWLAIAATGGSYVQGFQFEVYDGSDPGSRGQLVERGSWLDQGLVEVAAPGQMVLTSNKFEGQQGTAAQSATGLTVTQRIANIQTQATLLLTRR